MPSFSPWLTVLLYGTVLPYDGVALRRRCLLTVLHYDFTA
jgi:hypothetical protein